MSDKDPKNLTEEELKRSSGAGVGSRKPGLDEPDPMDKLDQPGGGGTGGVAQD